MQLTEDEVDVIRVSFREVSRRSQATADLFYDRLFAIAPHVRPLFPEAMDQQGTKLMSMLALIVAQLHDHRALVPLLSDLARRHVGYGALPPDYDQVGAALLWALERGLGDGFTPAVEAAWVRAYAGLTAAMLAAAHPEA